MENTTIDINQLNRIGYTVIDYAISRIIGCVKPEFIQSMIDNGLDLIGNRVLWNCICKRASYDIIKVIVDNGGSYQLWNSPIGEVPTSTNLTSLRILFESTYSLRITKLLIENGGMRHINTIYVEYGCRNIRSGHTLFTFIISDCKMEEGVSEFSQSVFDLMDLLIDNGVDINHINVCDSNMSALSYAMVLRNIIMANKLLDVNVKLTQIKRYLKQTRRLICFITEDTYMNKLIDLPSLTELIEDYYIEDLHIVMFINRLWYRIRSLPKINALYYSANEYLNTDIEITPLTIRSRELKTILERGVVFDRSCGMLDIIAQFL